MSMTEIFCKIIMRCELKKEKAFYLSQDSWIDKRSKGLIFRENFISDQKKLRIWTIFLKVCFKDILRWFQRKKWNDL